MSDPTMSIILSWINDKKHISNFPERLRHDIVTISLVIHNVDMILSNHIRKIYGSNFPIEGYTEKQKEYFLNQVELDSLLSNYFLKDISSGTNRRDVAIMLWVGGLVAAKGTRKTHVTLKGEMEYTTADRENDFKVAENYATKNEILRTGVEAGVVLELLVRKNQ